MRVLVLEDDADLCELMEVVLVQNGIECCLAKTLLEAQKLIKSETFDALVLDLILPDGNGLDLLTFLPATENKDSAVVVTSGNISSTIRNDPRVACCFQKPFELKSLMTFLASVA